jgi:hypothetical protein
MLCALDLVSQQKMFSRPHHQRIAEVLKALNGPLLKENNCLFGGGTAIALRYGEYRESVDIDFLISDVSSYGNLRQLITSANNVSAIVRVGARPLVQTRDIRADKDGIRTMLMVEDQAIKFEIVFEGRIELALPGTKDEVCGIATLTPLDMATSKLLANSDRWYDDGVFSRDIIDLAMMNPPLALLRSAIEKAETAYRQAIRQDLEKAISRLQSRDDWFERCMQVMAIELPKAVVWQQLRKLRRVLK